MVKENIFIPKENLAKVEEIRYLENKENSRFEKCLKSVLPTAYCMPDKENGASSFGGPSVEFGVKAEANSSGSSAMVKAGVDVASAKAGAVETRIGLNTDTGASVGTDGVEVKAGGFGFSAGKKTGISTPFGEVAVKTDDCVVQ